MAAVGLLPALSLCAGVAAGLGAPWPARVFLWILLPAVVAAPVGWMRGWRLLTTAALVVGFAACGAASAAHARDQALRTSLRQVLDGAYGSFDLSAVGPGGRHDPLSIRARIVEDAAVRDGFVSVRVEVREIRVAGAWRPAAGGVTLSVSGAVSPSRAAEWTEGRAIEAPVTFRRPSRYLDEGVADVERDLALAGTTLLGSVKSGLLVGATSRGSWIEETAALARRRVRRAIGRWIGPLDPTAAAITTAVLIGDRAAIPDTVRDGLQAAGTYHVIAISGGNIAIFVTLASGICAVLGLGPRSAAVATLAALGCYGAAVVSGPSVRRAVLVALVYLLARALDHRATAWHAAAAAAALMLAVWPLDLRDPGFVLTFGAAGALLLVAARRDALVSPLPATRWLVEAVIASMAVEVALFAVQAREFSRITLAGVGLNLIAVPLMAVVQLAGMTVVACDICRLPAGLAAMAAHWASAGIVRSAGWVDLAPALAPRVPPPGAAIVAGYYAALAVAVWGRGRVRTAGAATCAVVALSIGASSRLSFGAEPKKTELVRLTVFDVGQGDSMLLEAGDEAPLLIDTGGAPFGSPFDIGTRVLVPAIWARGVRRVSTMVVTHADPDHIGGAPGILAAMPVGAVWLGILVPGHPPTEALVAAFERRKRFVTAVRAGDSVTHGGVRLRVLNPPAPDWERRRVRNDDSIVVEAVAGDVATLFTGDIGADVEQTIAPRLTPARIRVLKVAHHGSRTSTGAALLDAWRPQVAVISAGRGNSFGHPAADVLDRLVGVGATVLRTDRDGEITIETDGRRLTWRTYTGKAGAIH